MRFFVEGPDHPNACDILTQHNIHPVQKTLHLLKNGRGLFADKQRQNDDKHNAGHEQKSHGWLDGKCHGNPQNRKSRNRQHHLDTPDKRLLNYGHIVECTRDHRGRSKLLKIMYGKSQ